MLFFACCMIPIAWIVQEKRCGCGSWGEPGEGCGCGNCCGGFECPQTCGSCGCGCCPQLNFPVTFGACVNNPCCECCQKKPPKGKCQWPCMWPCCCECDPPKFKFTPLKPKPMCHCPNSHGCCGGKKSVGELICSVCNVKSLTNCYFFVWIFQQLLLKGM